MTILPCILTPSLLLNEARTLTPNVGDDHRALREAVSSIALGSGASLRDVDVAFLFDYDIFPRTILDAVTEWRAAMRAMRVGDTIVQRVFIPPIGRGICLEFAVRITSVVREERRAGFAYATLDGHVERGVSEFMVEEIDGELRFTIRTWSGPGHWLGRGINRPVAAAYQAWCTRRALAHVGEEFGRRNRLPALRTPGIS